MKVRLIIVSTEGGSREDVIFTDDHDVPATDFCTGRQTVDFDQVIEANLPAIFPMDYTLHRE